jgi:hypothetical protein
VSQCAGGLVRLVNRLEALIQTLLKSGPATACQGEHHAQKAQQQADQVPKINSDRHRFPHFALNGALTTCTAQARCRSLFCTFSITTKAGDLADDSRQRCPLYFQGLHQLALLVLNGQLAHGASLVCRVMKASSCCSSFWHHWP